MMDKIRSTNEGNQKCWYYNTLVVKLQKNRTMKTLTRNEDNMKNVKSSPCIIKQHFIERYGKVEV
jgi:hypothetical protein